MIDGPAEPVAAAVVADAQTTQAEIAADETAVVQAAITEREEVIQEGMTDREEIRADAEVAIAQARGSDDEWRMQIETTLSEMAAGMTEMSGAISQLASSQLTPIPQAPVIVEPPAEPIPEAVAVAVAPEEVGTQPAPPPRRKRVLF